jgi:hypothetical protein
VPSNQQATITVRSNSDNGQVFVFNFQIEAAVGVSVSPKFSVQTAGGPTVDLTVAIDNDPSNAGATWTLTAGGTNCSPQCGALLVDAAPALMAHYAPPATAPTGASASPQIAVTSVADASKSDSFSFTIVAPPISVTILNKFAGQLVGGPGVIVSAAVTNDAAGAGVTWVLTSSTGACSPSCGTLVPSVAPSFSATYTPPSTAPMGPSANPSITATSVTDPTKNDTFPFSIASASAVFNGPYAFALRGFTSAGVPMAMAGSVSSDGMGNINGGEVDLNENGVATLTPGLSGTYNIDSSFGGIPRITISLTAGAATVSLKGVLSTDGTRGRIIEYDGSLRVNAGAIFRQDQAALANANPAGTYAFGLDSDAGTSSAPAGTITGRIVEAGQFTLGTGGTSVTGGVADAGQAGAPAVLLGNGLTPASITAGAATAPDHSGRGTLTLIAAGNTNTYAYYVVNTQQLNLIEIDSGGTFMTVQSGTALQQKALDATSINTTSVAALTGAETSGGSTATDAIVGVITVSGGSGGTAIASFEGNFAGSVSPMQNPSFGNGSVFSFDPATGRGVLLNTFFFGVGVYLYDVGKGFVIDLTPSGHGVNRGFSGPLVPQVAGPFSVQGDIAGNAIAVAGGSSTAAIPNLDFAVTFDDAGAYSTEVDFTSNNLSIGSNGQAQNAIRQGAYVLTDANVGRGTISFVPGIFGDFSAVDPVFGSFYIISPHQFVAIGQGPLGNGGDSSGILYFDPQ